MNEIKLWSKILLILCVVFLTFTIIIYLDLRFSGNHKLQSTASKPDSTQISKADTVKLIQTKKKEKQSFAFLGYAETPEFAKSPLKKHNSKPPRKIRIRQNQKRKPSPQKKIYGSNNPREEGYIPEMNIEILFVNEEEIQRHYSYLLIAVSKDRILGAIKNGRFIKLSEGDLRKFSKRARKANPKLIDEYLQAIQKNLYISKEEIKFRYLVPLNVESYFINIELKAIKEKGLKIQEVGRVDAFYDREKKVKVKQIIKKDGTVIPVNGIL